MEFSTLVSRAAEESFLSLKDLVEKSKSSELSDSEKKINLLKYIVKTQQRMLRLNVLAKWCQQVFLSLSPSLSVKNNAFDLKIGKKRRFFEIIRERNVVTLPTIPI